MQISKIDEIYCDDRRVGEVLRALAGKVIGKPLVVPVVNAEKTSSNKIKAKGDGNLVMMFAKYLRQARKTDITATHAREWLESHGHNPTSVSYLLHKSQEFGFLKKFGKGTKSHYKVASKIDIGG